MTTATPPRFEELSLDVVKPHPKNVRRSIGSLTELTDSIKAQGLLQPVVVAPGAKAGTYVLITGHRRHAAAKRAKLKALPCVVRDDLTDEVDQIAAMLVENVQRADLDAVEEGDAYQALLDLHVPIKKIAATTGRAQKTVRERVKIAAAPAMVRDKVIARQVSIEDALALESFADDEEAYNKLAGYLGTTNWAWALRDAKTARDLAKEIAKIRAELTAEGIPELTADEMDAIVSEHRLEGRNFQWTGPQLERPDADWADLAIQFATYGRPADRVRWFQLVPARTDDAPAAPATPTTKSGPTGAERAAARAQLEADLTTAATVRRDHLGKAIADGADDLAHHCLLRLIEGLFDEEEDRVELTAALLSITPPVWKDDEDDQDRGEKLRARVVEQLHRRTVPQLAILLRVLDRIWFDSMLKRPESWAANAGFRIELDGWRTELAEQFGYEWSDIEAQLIDAARSATPED